jgi:hypothetical protein
MRRKRIAWVIAALIGLPIALFVLYIFVGVAFFVAVPTAEDYSHRTTFEAKAWRDRSFDRDPEWPTRLRMIDDLLAKRRLDGLTRNELLALLGPSDQTSNWRDWHLVYWLGPERTVFRIDSEWLVIKFDTAGRVASYRIAAD